MGWNHRKYDSVTAQSRINPPSLKWLTSFRGANSSSYPGTIYPPRGCACNTVGSAPAKTGTFYSLNTSIWFNCYLDVSIPGMVGGSVNFKEDYSRWNPYFQWLGPGFVDSSVIIRNGGKMLDASVIDSYWY